MLDHWLLTILLVLYSLGAAALFLYGLNCYVMVALFLRRRRVRAAADARIRARFEARVAAPGGEDRLPVVTTQLPIFNERFVVQGLLEAVCAMDWPRDRHEIQVLDDSTDETRELLARLVQRLRAAGHDIHHLHRTDRQGYKAGALAAGLAKARGEHVAIFDADFLPPPDFLRRTVPFLEEDPGCGFVQARWGHRNREASLLTQAQAIGIDGHFVVEQSARAWNGLFLNFNGTAGVWRRRAIESAGGWQADTITEDLDLSYRAQLAGWRGRFLFDVVAPAELPADLNALKSQQHRWAKGSIQTARKLLPRILGRRDLGWWKKLQAVLHLTHYLVHPILITMTVLILPLLLWVERSLGPALLTGLVALMAVSLVAPSALYAVSQRATTPRWTTRLRYFPALVLLGVGLAVNNTRGVLEALLGHRRHEFRRTPKLGAGADARPAAEGDATTTGALAIDRGYRAPRAPGVALELGLGLWALTALGIYTSGQRFLIGPVLVLHAVGFLAVGTLTLVHSAQARRWERTASRPAPKDGAARGTP